MVWSLTAGPNLQWWSQDSSRWSNWLGANLVPGHTMYRPGTGHAGLVDVGVWLRGFAPWMDDHQPLFGRRSLTDVAVHHEGLVESPAIGKCAGPIGSRSVRRSEIRLGIQFGISYAPAILIQELGLLEKRLPGIKVTEVQFGSGAEVTQAMLSGEIDVGFMGVAPFLEGWARGLNWKIASALGDVPIGMTTVKPGARTLRDA